MGFSKKKSKISIDFWNLRNFFWPEILSCWSIWNMISTYINIPDSIGTISAGDMDSAHFEQCRTPPWRSSWSHLGDDLSLKVGCVFLWSVGWPFWPLTFGTKVVQYMSWSKDGMNDLWIFVVPFPWGILMDWWFDHPQGLGPWHT